MGHKLLMKTFILSIVIVEILFAATDIKIIDELVKDIKKERTGLSKIDANNTIDPFVKVQKIKEKSKPIKKYKKEKRPNRSFFLSAIVNEKVKINSKWYNINSNINGYRIIKIGDKYVVLKRGKRTIYLYLKYSKNKNIKFSIY